MGKPGAGHTVLTEPPLQALVQLGLLASRGYEGQSHLAPTLTSPSLILLVMASWSPCFSKLVFRSMGRTWNCGPEHGEENQGLPGLYTNAPPPTHTPVPEVTLFPLLYK